MRKETAKWPKRVFESSSHLQIASIGNNGIQARFEEDCSRQGMPEVPLSNMHNTKWLVDLCDYHVDV